VLRSYRRFVAKVAAARGRKVEEIEALAQGRVWSGAQALKNGLIDQIGGLSQAISVARALAKIPEDQEMTTVIYPKPRGFMEWLIEGLDIRSRLELPWPLDLARRARGWLQLRRGQPLALLPWIPELR
jgi:protease-4